MAGDVDNVSKNVLAAIEAVAKTAADAELAEPGLNLWVRWVLASFASIASTYAEPKEVEMLAGNAAAAVASRSYGEPLSSEEVIARAKVFAVARGSDRVVARDLVSVILQAAGLELTSASAKEAPTSTEAKSASTVGPLTGEEPPPNPAAKGVAGPTRTQPTTDQSAASGSGWPSTPTIDRFGRDFTEEARAGKILPAFGREKETDTLIEVLCRTKKRNPLLVGPAGSGKTAIVESFACRVAADEVPEVLKGVRVMAVETSALVGGTRYAGSFEERIQKIVAEASQPGVILFLDEAHTALGAGGQSGNMADALKPALAGGSLALIAATTDDEYRLHIKPDRAFERRFQYVPIAELGPEATIEILKLRRDFLRAERGVEVPDEILTDLVDFAEENLRNRTFPDKALDLLEQCTAYATAQGLDAVGRADTSTVLSRLLDVAIPPGEAISRLAAELEEMGAVGPDCQRLIRRLTTTLNGLDLRTTRPNLVLALSGSASEHTGALAEALARALFGAEERVITVDVSPIQDDEHLSVLVGSMPGYVGYGRRLPIHALEVTPRTVVLFTGADVCHPLAADIIAKGLAQGYIADTTGTRYYLSDAIVLLPTSSRRSQGAAAPLGFVPASADTGSAAKTGRESLERLFGASLADQVDVHLCELGPRAGVRDEVIIAQAFLPDIAERYERHGISLSWGESVASHLAGSATSCSSRSDLERFVEEWVSNLVMPTVQPVEPGKAYNVRLSVKDGQGIVEVEWAGQP